MRSQEDDLVIYDAQASLDGEVYLRPDGLTGGGSVKMEDSELTADLYFT